MQKKKQLIYVTLRCDRYCCDYDYYDDVCFIAHVDVDTIVNSIVEFVKKKTKDFTFEFCDELTKNTIIFK